LHNTKEIFTQHEMGEAPQKGLTQCHKHCDMEDATQGQMVEFEVVMEQQPLEEDACRQAQALLMESGNRDHITGKRRKGPAVFRNVGFA
jgi:hypothetical protein